MDSSWMGHGKVIVESWQGHVYMGQGVIMRSWLTGRSHGLGSWLGHGWVVVNVVKIKRFKYG